MFITIDLMYGGVRSYDTKEAATKDSLRLNQRDPEHPAFELYELRGNGKKAWYLGRLWREFGQDFDKDDPWNPNE